MTAPLQALANRKVIDLCKLSGRLSHAFFSLTLNVGQIAWRNKQPVSCLISGFFLLCAPSFDCCTIRHEADYCAVLPKGKILLRDLQAHDIQMFYQEQLQRVKASSVIHYHANIHKALKYAVKNDMIPSNPADKVERPKQDKFYGNFYDRELSKLFETVAGTKLELPVLLGAFYGLRQSEIIDLKWSAVDFEQNTITINHTVTSCNLDGKCVIVAKDTAKTKFSRRTLPLVPYFHEKLLAVKAQQEKNQKLCGRSYNKEFLEYICVDDIGDRFKPIDYSSKLTSASAMKSNFHLGS